MDGIWNNVFHTEIILTSFISKFHLFYRICYKSWVVQTEIILAALLFIEENSIHYAES